MIGITGALALATLGLILWACRYGYDFTDEGYYLLWMRSPGDFSLSTSQFGFIYHPLYLLAGGNIATIRIVGLLIVFGLAWFLGFRIVAGLRSRGRTLTGTTTVVTAALATSSLAILGPWLPTPNYNGLGLMAFLIAAIGLSYVWRPSRYPLVGWALLGGGIWLALMAKPPAAVLLAVLVAICLAVMRTITVRGAATAVAVGSGLLVVSAFLIDGSLSQFVHRFRGGSELLETAQAGHSLQQSASELLDTLLLRGADPTETTVALMIAAALLAAVAGILAQNSSPTARVLFVLVSLILAAAAAAALMGRYQQDPPDPQGSLIVLAPLLACIVIGFGVALRRKTGRGILAALPASALFFLLPFAFAFGSSNAYTFMSPLAGVFWVMAGVLLVVVSVESSRTAMALIPVSLITVLAVAAIATAALAQPYRQPAPLLAGSNSVGVNPDGSGALVLDPGTAEYIGAIRQIAQSAGFQAGAPLIDLTGASPGVAYILGAKTPGQPWIAGAYPGSEQVAIDSLAEAPCEELAAAWILSEPGGPREIPASVLESFGASAADDFAEAGSVRAPDGYPQSLLKPTRDRPQAAATCQAARQASAG